MKFAIISPTAGLEKYAMRSDLHLVLPQVRNTTYREFYLRQKQRGDTLILDCGAYEGEFDWQTWESALLYYRPQVVALPDLVKGMSGASRNLSIQGMLRIQGLGLEPELMYIPQGPSYSEWVDELERFLQLPPALAPIKWVALPRWIAVEHHSLSRIEAAMAIKQVTGDVFKIHAFGMSAGNIHELWALDQAGVYSIDSSAPVWRGWNHFGIRDEGETKWDGLPVNFDAGQPTSTAQKVIEYNLQEVANAGANITWR